MFHVKQWRRDLVQNVSRETICERAVYGVVTGQTDESNHKLSLEQASPSDNHLDVSRETMALRFGAKCFT